MWRWCQDDVKMMWRWCEDDVKMMSRWCEDDVKMMWRWCQDDVKMMSRWCQDDVKMMSRWCQDDVKMMSRWCQDDVKMMSRWCEDDVKMMSRWCHLNDLPSTCSRLRWHYVNKYIHISNWTNMKSFITVTKFYITLSPANPWWNGSILILIPSQWQGDEMRMRCGWYVWCGWDDVDEMCMWCGCDVDVMWMRYGWDVDEM